MPLQTITKQWQQRWYQDFAIRFYLGKIVQEAAFRPRLACATIALLQKIPRIFSLLVRFTRG
jgi:hypothetical protein